MTTASNDQTADSEDESAGSMESTGPIDSMSLASVALSALGFLTLLRLADRQERTPARALRLFFATTSESIGGALLGVVAVKRSDDALPDRNVLLAGAGIVLGVVTTLLNFNWMRTRRRL
jgi:hypothetical protein